jgi:LAS superfamily LD-carboxypeptidase LdcB
MGEESRRRYGVELAPEGPLGSYRTLADQQYLYDLYRSGRGNLVAEPGQSNHGEGLAVDFTRQGRQIVDEIGAAYGWSKAWSDAPTEPWHVVYKPGVWQGAASQ